MRCIEGGFQGEAHGKVRGDLWACLGCMPEGDLVRFLPGKMSSSGKNKGYRNKGGRKFCANLREFCKNNGLTPPFITSKFGQFRANPANFMQIRPMLFLSTIFGLTPSFVTPPFVRFQAAAAAAAAAAVPGRRPAH